MRALFVKCVPGFVKTADKSVHSMKKNTVNDVPKRVLPVLKNVRKWPLLSKNLFFKLLIYRP